MDRRGGGCIARYSSGRGCGHDEIAYGMSKVERIMLKFRPIAPKPMASGSVSSCSTVEHSDGSGPTPRRKRNYVRVNGNKKKNKNNTVSKIRKVSPSSSGSDTVVTLSLMPETPDRKEKSPSPTSTSSVPITNCTKPSTSLLSFKNLKQNDHIKDVVMIPSLSSSPSLQPKKSVAVSSVTVENVMDTWINKGLEFRDQDRVMSMEMDTCPSFITNNRDTVVWTNKAYREMISGNDLEYEVVVVKKFNRVTIPVSHPGFTCTVKVTWGTERGSAPSTITAPCDMWRLSNGGYAWRLDVKAALSLGRYS